MMDPLIIGLAGDVMIGRGVDRIISEKGYAYPWGNILPTLRATDLNLVNLETTLTKSNKLVDKYFNFKAAPDRVATLKEAHIEIVNLANNHILDFDEEGLEETIHTLDVAGIRHAGAGSQEAAAREPIFLTIKENRIGILGLTDNEPGWKAGTTKAGTNYINVRSDQDRETVLQSIHQLRPAVDLLIVSIHWGYNMITEPSSSFISLAHDMIEAGVDVIHGHSAHVFQAIEVFHNKLILYDTGDFVDDYRVDPLLRNDLSFFYELELVHKKMKRLLLTPILISNYQVNKAEGEDYTWCINRIRQFSEKFSTAVSMDGTITLFDKQEVPGIKDLSFKN